MSHKCKDDPKKIKRLIAKDACIKNLKVKNEDVKNANIDSANIKNLNVCTINGKAVCPSDYQNIVPTFQTVDYELNGVIVPPFTPGSTPVQPNNTSGINFQVWNALWNNTVDNLTNAEFGLAERLQCGRLTKKYIQNQNGCVSCPNPWPDCNPVDCANLNCQYCSSGQCPSVPIRILALDTYPLVSLSSCGCTGSSQTLYQNLSSVSYNLDVRNVNDMLDTRTVSVMVQIGYLDETNTPQVLLIDFSNKQFDFTLDGLFGEKFASNVLISSTLVQDIIKMMPQIYNNYAAAQIVVYVEQGVEVQFIPPVTTRAVKKDRAIRAVGTSGGSANAQYLGNDQLTHTLYGVPGKYPVIPGQNSYIAIKGGGGGGAPGSVEPPPYGGGGGGSGYFLIVQSIPSNAAFFVLTDVGAGGLGGIVNGAQPTNGGKTSGYFTDASGVQVSPVYTAAGGESGLIYEGGPGYEGGGGGGGTVSGPGGTGSNGQNGAPGNSVTGNGGDGGMGNGGRGGRGGTPEGVLLGGGGGGGGQLLNLSDFAPACGEPTGCGIPGGAYNSDGYGYGAFNPTQLAGVGGGGGGTGGNGGNGAIGYLLIVQ